MKRTTTNFIALMLFPAWCHCQDLWVLSPASAEGQSQHYHLTCTIGEPVIHSGASAQHVVTQGFQQPDYKGPVPVREMDREQWQLTIFPNPASTGLNIRFQPPPGETLLLEVRDMSGRTLVPTTRLPDSGSYKLAVGHFAPGAYAIRFLDGQGRQTAFLFQVVR